MSSIFLFFLLLVTLFLVIKKRVKYSCITLTFALAYFLLIGTGIIPALLLKPLQAPFINLPVQKWKNNNIIILLGGGTVFLPNSTIILPYAKIYSRIEKTAELYFSCKHQYQHQCKILITGGLTNNSSISEAVIYERALMKLGVNHDDFILETNSSNTHQNAQFSRDILENENFDQIILVTSGIHLKRSLLWFNYFNINAIPALADYERASLSIMGIGSNFALTDVALHEYLGIIKFYFDTVLMAT